MEFTKNNSPKHCTILWANHSKTFPIQVMYGHFRTPWSLLNPEMRRQSHPTELPFSPLISPSIKLRCFGQRKFHQPMCINHIQHVKTLDQHTNPAQMWKQFPPKKSHPSSSSNPPINIFIFQPHSLPSPTPPRPAESYTNLGPSHPLFPYHPYGWSWVPPASVILTKWVGFLDVDTTWGI